MRKIAIFLILAFGALLILPSCAQKGCPADGNYKSEKFLIFKKNKKHHNFSKKQRKRMGG